MVLLTVCLAGLPLVTSAELTFPERELELNARPSDEKVSFVFNFSNGGENTVNIEDVNVSCACLSAKITIPVSKASSVRAGNGWRPALIAPWKGAS
jgi:hypothetical protein